MSYLGDYSTGATADFKFTTVDSSGVPAALSSGDLRVWRGNSTASSTAGVTLSSTFASVVGLNHGRVVMTSTFYEPDADFQVTLSTGAVDGKSVVGYTVAAFSITRAALSTAQMDRLANHTLGKASSSVTGAHTRSLVNAQRLLRNRWEATSSGILNVYEEDDATVAWSATMTASSGANPITQIDPS